MAQIFTFFYYTFIFPHENFLLKFSKNRNADFKNLRSGFCVFLKKVLNIFLKKSSDFFRGGLN